MHFQICAHRGPLPPAAVGDCTVCAYAVFVVSIITSSSMESYLTWPNIALSGEGRLRLGIAGASSALRRLALPFRVE